MHPQRAPLGKQDGHLGLRPITHPNNQRERRPPQGGLLVFRERPRTNAPEAARSSRRPANDGPARLLENETRGPYRATRSPAQDRIRRNQGDARPVLDPARIPDARPPILLERNHARPAAQVSQTQEIRRDCVGISLQSTQQKVVIFWDATGGGVGGGKTTARPGVAERQHVGPRGRFFVHTIARRFIAAHGPRLVEIQSRNARAPG